MKRHLCGHALLALAVVVLPVASVACKHKSSGGSSGTEPSASANPSSSVAVDDNTDDTDDDSGPDTPDTTDGGGGGKKHRHAKHNKNEGDGGGGTEPAGAKFVINHATPEPMDPPALRKQHKMPPLPNLPERSKYAHVADAPKGGDAEGCGQVWNGEKYQPVECVDPDHHSKHPRAAKVVVPYDKMKQPEDKLPKMVDHRFDQTEGQVRTQGGPQCTAFALTAGFDHAYARWTGKPGDFAVMQVWARYKKLEEKAATDTNIGDYLANESDWPYDAKEANSWTKCGEGVKPCGKPVDEAKLKELNEKKKVAEVTELEVVGATQFAVMKEKIAGGEDLVIGLKLPSFATAGEAGNKYIVGSQKGKAKEGHETLLAGYAETPHGTYYLIHNSWGPKWGDEGYAWIHQDLIKEYWLDNRIVVPDVEPIEVMRIRGKRHGELVNKCENGKVPDTITGECAGKCADGGPRHNNVCPKKDKNDCPAGHINLTGECVMSAPKASGTEGKVKWECAEAGCVYEVPKGELGCNDKECQASCPAPDFRLASTKKGLVCVE